MLGRLTSKTQAPDLVVQSLPLLKAWLGPAALGILGLLSVAWYAAQVVVLDHTAQAAITSSVATAHSPLQPGAPIQLSVQGAGVELQSASLYRMDTDSPAAAEQPVAARLQPTDEPGAWQLVAADGNTLLRPDGAYRLLVQVAAPRPGLPLPRTDVFTREYRFSTLASPHASLPPSALAPRWGEPVSLAWSLPMQSVSASAEPNAPVKGWVDSRDPTRTWFQLGSNDQLYGGLADGQTVTVHIAAARAQNGLDLQRPLSFPVAIPARPRFVDVPSQPVTLTYGQTLTLKASTELASADVSTSGDVPTKIDVGKNQVTLALPDFQQGAEFDLTVNAAQSSQGAPLAQPVQVHVVTPPALDAPSFEPADGAVGIQLSTRPAVVFPEPVTDQAAALGALQIEPNVAGHWEWSAPTRLEFVPDGRLPILTTIHISVRGGPDGPRSAAGGFLDDDVSGSFKTTDNKRMDVSLSHQTMTLYENNVPIRTIYVATGVAAAPTPTGTFYVQYKAPQMRFQGVNPDGSHYDIPDVHWVMPFWGDYTIHGAYWRPRFGVPGSDGCISMTDADAKLVYDWADVGTPVVIHS